MIRLIRYTYCNFVNTIYGNSYFILRDKLSSLNVNDCFFISLNVTEGKFEANNLCQVHKYLQGLILRLFCIRYYFVFVSYVICIWFDGRNLNVALINLKSELRYHRSSFLKRYTQRIILDCVRDNSSDSQIIPGLKTTDSTCMPIINPN